MGRTREVSKILTADTSLLDDYLTLTSASSTYTSLDDRALVLLNTTEFTGASSVSLNNVFNSNYNNYKIVINASASSAVGYLLRYRASGTDVATGYYLSNIYMLYSSSTVNGSGWNNATFHYIGDLWSGIQGTYVLDIGNPYKSQRTTFNFHSYGNDYFTIGSGQLANTNLYDGFTIYGNSSATTSGTVRVYGYKDEV